MNGSQIEVIVLDGDNGLESDAPEDESTSAIETSFDPLQITTEDEVPKSPVHVDEKSPIKVTLVEKAKNTEDEKNKPFSEKLPTEWSVSSDLLNNLFK